MKNTFKVLLSATISFNLLFAPAIIYAGEFSFEEAVKKCKEYKLSLPKPEEDGRIQTFNRKGAMSPVLDQATIKFIEYANNKKVLEIGGAYGKVMIETLTKIPNVIYHINDLDERHLFIAAQNLKETIEQKKNNTSY